jgi:hypothetical protein
MKVTTTTICGTDAYELFGHQREGVLKVAIKP